MENKKNKQMKRYLLLIITLGINVIVSAQNYIGKTQKQITDILDSKSIEYSTYYTKDGNLGIQYELELEKRIYAIGANGICDWYTVLSNDDGFVYNMRKYASSKQFKQTKVTDNYLFVYKKANHEILIGTTTDESKEDVNSVFYGWAYFFVYSVE